MAFSSNTSSGGPMSEINVTPLVDVMLVLLIIFMITAPLMSHKIKVTLPKADPNQKATEIKVPPIDLAVESDGTIYWNDSKVDESEFKARLAVTAQQYPQPALNIRADKDTPYKFIKMVMSDAQAEGMVHLGFVTTGKMGKPGVG
ncbi:MAG TPA: biopolymer transporter ExbD [Rhodanobacteraceae bacterium]|nr:biopolymer transporter ExbD [Rhodanobacteraceae bacterium]